MDFLSMINAYAWVKWHKAKSKYLVKVLRYGTDTEAYMNYIYYREKVKLLTHWPKAL